MCFDLRSLQSNSIFQAETFLNKLQNHITFAIQSMFIFYPYTRCLTIVSFLSNFIAFGIFYWKSSAEKQLGWSSLDKHTWCLLSARKTSLPMTQVPLTSTTVVKIVLWAKINPNDQEYQHLFYMWENPIWQI